MSNIQAVLFDLDGTLIDSAIGLGAAADRMRTQRGLPSLPHSAYRTVASSGARGLLKVAFGITPEHPDYAAHCQEFLSNYENHLFVCIPLFDGIAAMLHQLAQHKLPWGIVTNKAARFTDPIARTLPELRSAAAVISGDTTAHTKPHPAPLLEAARRMGIAANRCLYVGDDKRDMDAAKAAGMPCIAALWGYLGEHAVASWGADAQAQHPSEILHLLATQQANT